MPREEALRRPGFSPGHAIRMADDRVWTLPGPCSPGVCGPEYQSLIDLCLDAEDEADRLRAELALVIFLLDRNYHMTPAAFGAVLGGASSGDRPARMQIAFHAVVEAHVSQGRANVASRSMSATPRPESWRTGLARPAN